MPTRYRVAQEVEGNIFSYPADPISLRTIRDNGGISKLTEADREKLKFKTVGPGDDCSDMPEPALSIYLERGWVVKADTKAEIKDGE